MIGVFQRFEQSWRKIRELNWLLAWLAATTLAIIVLIIAGRSFSETHLRASAERSAVGYAEVIGAAVIDLESILKHGTPSPRALMQLSRLQEVGRVFRFKLFDKNGALLLVSDQMEQSGIDARSALGRGRTQQEAMDVILSRESHVVLKDGREKPGRPDSYSEAYVPVVEGPDIVGVIEVYVDQTDLAASNQQLLSKATVAVFIVLSLLGLLGALQRRTERKVLYLAKHDMLSGALNRASFQDELRSAATVQKHTQEVFAVLCVDLDRFKEVNDSLGHAAGDEVLRVMTSRVRSMLRQSDYVARLGGDEFAILQSGIHDSADVRDLAERIVDQLAVPYEINGRSVRCGGSVGAAIYGIDSTDLDELLHKADLALYRAKANGRGCFSFYDEALDFQLQERQALACDLRAAIEHEQLTIHFQALFEADGLRVSGCEALLRWQHPLRGHIGPDTFIPIAEDSGMIVPLGEWVLREACREAASWEDDRKVAVNLSPIQFKQGDLVETVRNALAESKIPPHRLELEVTESLLMGETEQVMQVLKNLSELGVHIVMDDFGTGYSSLAYLWKFPFDKIKIDKSFTHALEGDQKADLIVSSIISLAHSLHIKVNAEGVETESQMAILKKHGCDELQGFLLARPTSAELVCFDCASSSHSQETRLIGQFASQDKGNAQPYIAPLLKQSSR